MKETHRVTFYRRVAVIPGGSQFDPPSNPQGGWTALEPGGVAATFVPTAGDVRQTAAGREVRIAGTLFVHPSRLGQLDAEVRPDDGVQIESGPVVAPARFIVAEARRLGGGRFSDEFDVESTEEVFA